MGTTLKCGFPRPGIPVQLVFTLMSSWERIKMPPLPGRRGAKRSLWKRAAAGLDELDLEPWVSLWSNHFGEESTRLLPTRLDGKEQDAAAPPGRRGIRGTRATKSTAAEELARSSGSTRNYAASPDNGYQLGDDPAIPRPLY